MSTDKNQGKSFEQIEKEKFSDPQPKKLRRTFLGKLPGFGVRLNAFEKKEFRAYTRGESFFNHGIERHPDGTAMRNNDGSLIYKRHSTRVAYI